jgi:hypothetical protein
MSAKDGQLEDEVKGQLVDILVLEPVRVVYTDELSFQCRHLASLLSGKILGFYAKLDYLGRYTRGIFLYPLKSGKRVII